MHYLSSYILEAPCIKNGKKYSVLESVSLLLKIVALILLVVLLPYFYIAIVVWFLSMIVNYFKRNLLYKYVYEIENGVLSVYKEYNAEKHELCEKSYISSLTVKDNLSENARQYYETPTETLISIKKQNGEEFILAVDDYFYALLKYYGKGEKDDDILG